MKSCGLYHNIAGAVSPPARGAWIEILQFLVRKKRLFSRPPHGGRGLKLLS